VTGFYCGAGGGGKEIVPPVTKYEKYEGFTKLEIFNEFI